MTTTATLFPVTDSGDDLDRAVAARRRVSVDEAEQLDHIASYVQHATVDDPLMAARAGGPRMIQYGGTGTPEVCEFSTCEVAAALGLAPRTATVLVADALDLTYRLPKLFAELHDGTVEAWKARKTASATREFSEEQAARVDARLSRHNADGVPLLARVGMSRLRAILEQIHPTARPEDTDDEVARNLAQRYVDLRPLEAGVGDIHGILSTEDAARLDGRLNSIVESLRNAGDRRCPAELRSVALGILAEPARLDLLLDGLEDGGCEDEAETTDAVEECDDADSGTPDPTVREPRGDDTPFRKTPMPATVLYLHCDRASATWLLEGTGPIARSEAIEILGHSRVVIKPVIDLADNPTYTGYVAPPRLREHTALLNAGFCTFPYCGRPARGADYDHLVDYADGGATDACNGHRLCRFHHRAKTFTEWQPRSPAPGIWIWHSPDGRVYVVTAGTTTRIDDHIRHRRRQPRPPEPPPHHADDAA